MKTLHSLSSFINVFKKASAGKEAFQTFDDFLTLCIYNLTTPPFSGMYYEDVSRIIQAYKESGSYDDLIRLPTIFFQMAFDKTANPDMIAEFYMTAIASDANRIFLSPFPLCLEITQLFRSKAIGASCVLDTSVGTGRMLLAFAKNSKRKYMYHGINTSPVLAKLAVVNMFLHSLEGEVICAENSDPEKFIIGYKSSFNPMGIFRFEEKDKSEIRLMCNNIFGTMKNERYKKRLLFL